MSPKLINKNNFINKIKAFFKGRDWKKALVFFGFIVLAFVLWLMQYYQQRFETEVTIPIAYENIPINVILNEDLPSQITVKLTDKGSTLLNYNINRKNDSIQVNLANIDTTKNSYYVDYSTLTAIVRNHLQTSTSIQNVYPDYINVTYNPLVRKEVPIVLNNKISLAPGFIISGNITMTPSSVIVYGDYKTLDTITSIKTVPITNLELKENIQTNIDLVAPKRVRLSEKEVQLNLIVEEYTEKTFSIPIRVVDVPSKVNVRLFPLTAEITGNVLLKNYNQITASDFDLTINYKDLKEAAQSKISLKLEKVPNGLLNYRITPEEIEFIIEQQ